VAEIGDKPDLSALRQGLLPFQRDYLEGQCGADCGGAIDAGRSFSQAVGGQNHALTLRMPSNFASPKKGPSHVPNKDYINILYDLTQLIQIILVKADI
jgi:hypothetical protein